jgi:2-polyprenyl-3-methyl-5-hydroxy-6-metoxy-1,4-benzoquinol methylase
VGNLIILAQLWLLLKLPTYTPEKMIDITALKIKSSNIKNIHLKVSDIFDENWTAGVFDVIMTFNILCYIKNRDSFISRVFELLKPDGQNFSFSNNLVPLFLS